MNGCTARFKCTGIAAAASRIPSAVFNFVHAPCVTSQGNHNLALVQKRL